MSEENGNVSNGFVDNDKESFSFSEDYMNKIRLLLENWTNQNKFLEVWYKNVEAMNSGKVNPMKSKNLYVLNNSYTSYIELLSVFYHLHP